MMTPPTKSTQAFTLIEVLVTITVIAVLISISVPVVQNALGKSRSSACASNLRQLGVAFQLYAADNNGYFPAARFRDPYLEGKNPSRNLWQVEISPYLREIKNFYRLDANGDRYAFCPEYVSAYSDHPEFGNRATGGYGLNPELSPGNGWDLRYRRVNIENPSTAILAGDSCAYHLILINGGFEKDASLPGGYKSTHPDRHNGRANYLFVDGHVESLSPEDAQELLTP